MNTKMLICGAISLTIGLVIGYQAKVETRTKTVIQEVQPKCVHKFKSVSCVISGDSLKSANVIQECEKCGNIRKERVFL